MGLPRGPQGLKKLRHQVNAAIPNEHSTVTAVRFEGNSFIEADMVMDATQRGSFSASLKPVGEIRFAVHEGCRFIDGRQTERWAQIDLENIVATRFL